MISIDLDRSPEAYSPGESLSFSVRIERATADLFEKAEASVLWYTEGKGDEDLEVHEFWEVSPEQMISFFCEQPHWFTTHLPQSPLTYEGRLLRINWCARLRLFIATGGESVTQRIFYLGPHTKSI
jgi:hypothetical protein